MKKFTLLFIVMVVFSISNYSQSFTDLLNSNNEYNTSIENTKLVVTPIKGVKSVVSTYTNTVDFTSDYEANCYNPDGIISENFDGGPSIITTCGPMISSAGDGCFAPRELEVGFNVTASVGDVVFIPVGEIGNTISLVGANTFPDYTIINFPNNDVFAVGHSLWNSGNGITEYRIYGEGDILLETYTLTSAVSQEFFFGFIADEVITKVEIQAANDQGELFGEFLFGICNEPPPPPANDDCENAVSVTVDAEGTGCYSPTVATNLDATGSSEPDPACGSYSGGDVWYSFTAPATRAVKIIIPIVGEWSSFSGALYDGCAGTEIDCKVIDGIDISANVPAEDFYNNLTPGNTYYLRAWDNDNDDIGEVSFCIEEYTYVDIENIDNKGFTYFPNPVNSTLTLSSQDNIQNISIYNITGQLIINIIPNSNQTQIDLKRLVNGVYFVKATINNELAVFKIIKE